MILDVINVVQVHTPWTKRKAVVDLSAYTFCFVRRERCLNSLKAKNGTPWRTQNPIMVYNENLEVQW